jgi:cytochrome c oxidase subunit 2
MSGASSSAGTVDAIFWFIVGVSLFFLLLITFLMIFFIVKYNKKRHKKAVNISGNTALEIIWTVIPTIIVLIMFFLGWKGFTFIRSVPEDSMTINVTARMWSWLFEYENGIQTDTLYVPINRPVKLLLHSQDVIHSFYVPAFRIKEDAVPGYQNYLWFEANEPGNYDVLCAEYCGLRHAYMYTKVKALPENQFSSWQTAMLEMVEKENTPQTTDASQASASPTFAGKRLLRTRGCMACHSSDGSEMIGPTFLGLFGKTQIVIEGGQEKKVNVDEEYLRRSILKPNLEVVKGYDALMPSQEGQISEEELVAIIQYIKEL